jgi:adenosine deaminase
VVLCTDDSGVFSTTLSREYALAAAAFALTPAQLKALAVAGFEHCFAPMPVKQALIKQAKARLSDLPDAKP